METRKRLGTDVALALASLLTCGGLAACQSTKSYALRSGMDVVAYDASRRAAYIREVDLDKPRLFVIAEPSPDVATEYTALIDASVSGLEGLEAAKLKAEFNSKVIDLARRSQTLQILRESLYRLSELTANGVIKEDDAKQIYLEVLQSVQVIALTELGNSDMPEEVKTRVADEFFDSIPRGSLLDPNRDWEN